MARTPLASRLQSPAARTPAGGYFCGEHTTQELQGYLNGAVFSGERAASEVLSAI